ncbi:MAG: prolyl-tRNA synthetase associated domain-containing protein [Rhodospirillales bacterium]|nr:prolyl-tRNA synthetase associated domain-containing protein [Rhodospirillales bacterium]
MPATPNELLARLAALGIAVTAHHHPPVYTVEESKRLRGALPGGHCKNLFLKDRKDRLWLVVALEDRAIDLKALRTAIGSAPLSFGSPALLQTTLGIEPGSVTPFSLINDSDARVTVVLDEAMMGLELLNYHPLTNAQTAAIRPADLLLFLRATSHEPRILGL